MVLELLSTTKRMAQLPPEAEGVAVAILIYSFLCFFCNLLMLWLLWTSRQTFSRTSCFLFCLFLLSLSVSDNHSFPWISIYPIFFLGSTCGVLPLSPPLFSRQSVRQITGTTFPQGQDGAGTSGCNATHNANTVPKMLDIGVICMFTAISIVVNIIQQIHDNM